MIIVQLGANKGNDKLTEFVNNNHTIIDKLRANPEKYGWVEQE